MSSSRADDESDVFVSYVTERSKLQSMQQEQQLLELFRTGKIP